MPLEKYKKKRNFKKTSEPKAKIKKRSKGKPIYVIQKHKATRLHWDLRLEFDGVLRSWAVPKEPSKDPKVRRLAVEVEDHPLEYAKFEGEIPEGQYGGAEMFTAIFELLFYSNTTGFMLAIMVIGTFANIFVINQSRSSALQSATTLTVIGIPMIMIVSMFLGVIAPPSAFIRIFGAEAIASFVFTFAMLSVYIIFLSMMMVFTHAAEVFQPADIE